MLYCETVHYLALLSLLVFQLPFIAPARDTPALRLTWQDEIRLALKDVSGSRDAWRL
jgi:hypothetical protein